MNADASLFLPPELPARGAVAPEPPSVMGGRKAIQLEIGGSDEPLTVVNFRPTLPAVSHARDRSRFVQAVHVGNFSMDDESAHAIARALERPELGAALLKAGLETAESVETTTLFSLHNAMYLDELFPLLQPRSGALHVAVPHPATRGLLSAEGSPTAVIEAVFEDSSHLRAYLKETVRSTRVVGQRYDESILARGVTRPILAHVVRIAFRNGEESFDVIAVRDGITRVVSSWAARLGGNLSADALATSVADSLLATREARGDRHLPATQVHARGREEAAARYRAEFMQGMATGEPNEAAIRIRQTFTIPTQVYVGLESNLSSDIPAEHLFDDSIRSVVASIHVDFKAWDAAATQVETIDRAIGRAAVLGEMDPLVADLATGRTSHLNTAEIFGDARIPNTELWRAIYVCSVLSGRSTSSAIKRELRSLTGMSRISGGAYVRFFAPLVDLPWRGVKRGSIEQARRAWANGGPIPTGTVGSDWSPLPTSDFRDLVGPASRGDRNARLTLQVGGGIALIADKVLTSNIGSKLETRGVPYRADVNTVIDRLGTSLAGLWTLAHAANAFRGDNVAMNSLTETEARAGFDAGASYILPLISAEDPSHLSVDGAGQVRTLTERDLFVIADPDRAAVAAGEQSSASPSSPAEVLGAVRGDFLRSIAELNRNLARLQEAASAARSSGGQAFDERDQWDTVARDLMLLQAQVVNLRPAEETGAND